MDIVQNQKKRRRKLGEKIQKCSTLTTKIKFPTMFRMGNECVDFWDFFFQEFFYSSSKVCISKEKNVFDMLFIQHEVNLVFVCKILGKLKALILQWQKTIIFAIHIECVRACTERPQTWLLFATNDVISNLCFAYDAILNCIFI